VHKLFPSGSTPASESMTGPEFIEKLASVPLLYQPGTDIRSGLIAQPTQRTVPAGTRRCATVARTRITYVSDKFPRSH
jgi:hypothetical protein